MKGRPSASSIPASALDLYAECLTSTQPCYKVVLDIAVSLPRKCLINIYWGGKKPTEKPDGLLRILFVKRTASVGVSGFVAC